MRMHVMPEDQGQAVTVSYGCDGEHVYRRTTDADRVETWQRVSLEWLGDAVVEPWNGRMPDIDPDDWEPCNAPEEEAAR